MKATHDGFVDFVYNSELLSFIRWVSLESREDFTSLIGSEFGCCDDGNLLFLVDLRVELGILLGDFVDEDETLVFSKNLDELHGRCAEWSSLLEASDKFGDFVFTDTTILGEHAEAFAVLVE